MLKKIETLVQTQGHCVLATCGTEGGQCAPHTSLMGFCAAPDCAEFWLASLPGTRKYRNLAENPLASLLLDDRGGPCAGGDQPGQALTVQVRRAQFQSPAHEAKARRALLEKRPEAASFLALEGVEVLRLVAQSFQLLCGPTDVFFIEAEKMLDGRTRRA